MEFPVVVVIARTHARGDGVKLGHASFYSVSYIGLA